MKIVNFIIMLCFMSFIFSITGLENQLLSNEDYISGDDGVVRMYVNVVGHVKNPGKFLVYDGIDVVSVLALAGGYLQGSNLSNIIVYHKNGTSTSINLNKVLTSGSSYNEFIQLSPHDTILIEQKFFSQIFTSSNLPSVILSILNIALTIERTE
tara:strand:- start:892 stop:1353 length:462 start_codon:yes stop_codon:yes gene_type:complete